jgi:hypothetical protein
MEEFPLSPICVVTWGFDISHSVWCNVESHGRLICISLITKVFEHFFKCFSAIRDSSAVNFQFSSIPRFFIRVFFFFFFLYVCYVFVRGCVCPYVMCAGMLRSEDNIKGNLPCFWDRVLSLLGLELASQSLLTGQWDPGRPVYSILFLFCFVFVFVETGFLCASLAVLKLTL